MRVREPAVVHDVEASVMLVNGDFCFVAAFQEGVILLPGNTPGPTESKQVVLQTYAVVSLLSQARKCDTCIKINCGTSLQN